MSGTDSLKTGTDIREGRRKREKGREGGGEKGRGREEKRGRGREEERERGREGKKEGRKKGEREEEGREGGRDLSLSPPMGHCLGP